MTPQPTPPTPAGAPPCHVVVMGVSGTGKSTIAVQLAEHLRWEFVEGDELHPAANVDKMAAGVPLDDTDRAPWLDELGRLLGAHHSAGTSSVLTCSALRRSYRDVLRSRVPDGAVFFVQLSAPYAVLERRMQSREHFMPASLLRSQLDTLEPLDLDEDGVVIDVTAPVPDVVARASRALGC